MDITMIPTQTTSSSRVGMSACGHATGRTFVIANEAFGAVVRDRVATKGQLALAPAYTRGTLAWRPPLS